MKGWNPNIVQLTGCFLPTGSTRYQNSAVRFAYEHHGKASVREGPHKKLVDYSYFVVAKGPNIDEALSLLTGPLIILDPRLNMALWGDESLKLTMQRFRCLVQVGGLSVWALHFPRP